MKDASWINLLKLRVSYGEAGNNNIPTGQMVQSFISSTSTWINGVDNFWAASKTMANPDLKWETTVTQNIGLDFDLFKNKVTGSVEVYKNKTKDLLMLFPISGGYDNQYRNMGEIQNSGVEATLNLNLIEREKYGVSLSFNAAFNTNKINSLGVMNNFTASSGWASSSITGDYLVNVGQPLGIMYGYKSDGRYEVSDFDYAAGAYTLKSGVPDGSTVVGKMQPGAMKLKDIDGDGKVNANDLTVIGNANPKSTGGMVLNANAYGFDLSARFQLEYWK
ncbi:TonB-dependent receptor domain-containing protein [Flavobacterium sp. P21]|uniref:TonB-dependent receptor domain-containing protein n=1 Tax=Flavobacterium sp. P21 TaxID=3423948 RepID=UPI003D66FC7B